MVLNKKGEWNGSRIPRIRVEVGDKLDGEEVIARHLEEKRRVKVMSTIKQIKRKKEERSDDLSQPSKKKRRQNSSEIDSDSDYKCDDDYELADTEEVAADNQADTTGKIVSKSNVSNSFI